MYNYSPCGISALEKTTRLEWQQWSRVPLRSHEGSLLSREAGGLFQCRTTARVVIIFSPVNIACPLPPCNTRSRFLGCLKNRSTILKKSWRICFGNPGSKSKMPSKKILKDFVLKSSIKIDHASQKNPEGFCFGNPRSRSIMHPKKILKDFVFEILDQNRGFIPKIEKAISRTVRATNF